LQRQNLVQDILKSFHNTKEGIKQILLTTNDETGELAVIDPSAIGVHLKNVFDVLTIPLFNRYIEADGSAEPFEFYSY
jgi:hypothetical protein